MLPSIRQIFFNLKLALIILGLGVSLLGLQLINITQFSERLAALKNQHELIEKIVAADLRDIDMATIMVNGYISELTLSVKFSTQEALFDSVFASRQEQDLLSRSLFSSAKTFQDASLFWLEAMPNSREAMHQRMVSARNAYLIEIDHMIDYQIQLINQSVGIAKTTVMIVFLLGLIIFFVYRFRLNQIYRDINHACSVDIEGTKPDVKMQEIDFIVKRLARKTPISNTNPVLLNPLSGLNNEKGMLTLYNAKRTGKSSNSLFITLFEIDQYAQLSTSLSQEEMAAMYQKIGSIITMYEQTLDVIAHMDDNRFVFIMARNSKDIALNEAEKIVHSIHDSSFLTEKGIIKITLSAGFLLKTPTRSLEDAIADALKIVEKAKESGGNRVAQLRERSDHFR
ncbi:MAG TPA: diguanylate cyclase [Sulfuricurvum sp.]|nr:diguanylate cyclase [Sulfuricurvum sp.]